VEVVTIDKIDWFIEITPVTKIYMYIPVFQWTKRE